MTVIARLEKWHGSLLLCLNVHGAAFPPCLPAPAPATQAHRLPQALAAAPSWLQRALS